LLPRQNFLFSTLQVTLGRSTARINKAKPSTIDAYSAENRLAENNPFMCASYKEVIK